MINKHYILSYFDTKKSAIKKIRVLNKSYKDYIKKKKIYIFRKISGELSRVNLCFDKFFFSILVFFYPKLKIINLNVSLKQYVFQRMPYRRFNLRILEYHKKKNFNYPIPEEYYEVLSKNNIIFSKFKCRILWFLKCLIYWSYGNFILIKIIIKSTINLLNKNLHSDLYFFQIKKENLPFANFNKRTSYDLVSWFIKYYKSKSKNFDKISHDNKKISNTKINNIEISFKEHPYFYIKNIYIIFKFLIICSFLSIISFTLLLVGRWQSSFILNEIFKTISFLETDKKKLSKKYLFHYSESFYRPIWSYFKDEFNLEIVLYFYSTYDSPRDLNNPHINKDHEYGEITWDNILVWDEHHKKIILNYINKSDRKINIEVSGPIWFKDKKFIFKNKKFRILIFDLEVQRNSIHFGWGELAEYNNFNPNLTNKFVHDIYKVFNNDKVEFILKRKRKITGNSKTNYRKLIEYLVSKGNFIEIDEDIAPKYLIENSDIIITTPFTSANLYQDDIKAQNIYYDPINYVDRKDPASRNILLIKGLDELKAWKKSNLNVD